MQTGQPSRTARGAATHRAVHQILEGGRIFNDPLAIGILGEEIDELVRDVQDHPDRGRMRLFIAMRTRFAEDALAAAVEQGAGQLVVLGAGLDTYAYRGAMRDRLRIFEVDHPATQLWKRERLAAARIPLPSNVIFAPFDFERETLPGVLAAAGFDEAQPSFFTWLGVVPYLSEDAVFETLRAIAALPGGAHVVFDYSDPPDSLSPELRALHDARAAHVAQLGEAWVTYFDSGRLDARLADLGFNKIENLGPPQIIPLYFPQRTGPLPEKGGHVVHAVRLLNSK